MNELELKENCIRRIKDSLDLVCYESAIKDINKILNDKEICKDSKLRLIKYTIDLVMEDSLNG